MKRRTAGEWIALLAALVFGGAAAGFGVAILASFVGLPAPVVWALVVIVFIVIGMRIFRTVAPPEPATTPVEGPEDHE